MVDDDSSVLVETCTIIGVFLGFGRHCSWTVGLVWLQKQFDLSATYVPPSLE